MSECNLNESADLTYHLRNRDVILNRAKDYYENDKERLRGQARDRYRNLSEKEIDIVICLKKKTIRLKEYQKNYRKAKKSQYNNE